MKSNLDVLIKTHFPNKQLPDTYKDFLKKLENSNAIDDFHLVEFFYGDIDKITTTLIKSHYRFQWNFPKNVERIKLSDQKQEEKSNLSLEFSDNIFFDFNDFLETDEFRQRMHEHTDIPGYSFNSDMIDDYHRTHEVEQRNNIVLNNRGLVESIVIQYSWAFNSSSLTKDDLIQYGIIGLMKAIDRYDSSLGFEFSTYAYHWIRQSISRAIADDGYIVRIPVHMTEAISKLRKLEIKYEQFEDKISRICNEMEISEKNIEKLSGFNMLTGIGRV